MKHLRRLRSPSIIPTRGWKALQGDGYVISAGSFVGLIANVRKYLEANNPDGCVVVTKALVEDQICNAIPPEEQATLCVYVEDKDFTPNKNMATPLAFAKAVAVVVGHLAIGKQVCVNEGVAMQRASVCAQCPYNMKTGIGCWGCGGLGNLFRTIQGGLTTPLDAVLNSCGCCGCELKTKVWITNDALGDIEKQQGIEPTMFPSWCWRSV